MKSHISQFKLAVLFLAVCLAASFAPAAQDDHILVIDANNVVPEIDVLKQYLKENEPGTQVVLVPSEKRIPRKNREKIQQLTAQYELDQKYIGDHYTDAKFKACQSGSPQCDQRLMRALAAKDTFWPQVYQLQNGSGTGGALTLNDFLSDLDDALNSGVRFSRIIISGHHSADVKGELSDINQGYLSGELFGGFNSAVATKVLKNDRRLEGVRSLIMLGCWTGLEAMMKETWGQVLPSTHFVSGFITPAPLKTNPNGHEIFRSLLRIEKTMGQATSESEMREHYKKIKQFDRKIGVLVNGVYLSPTQTKRLR